MSPAPSSRLATAMALVLVLGAVLLASPVPVLDEESYLDIASQLNPLRPYDWWRPWQPWGAEREGDAFVFAHPPLHLLWVWAMMRAVPEELGMRALKVLSAAPWALLLAWSVATLARTLTRRPIFAVLTWASAPIVVLCLQRGLMPDLSMAALLTAGVAGWRLGTEGNRFAQVFGGLAMAAAVWTKYPAALLLPVLALHGRVALGPGLHSLRATLPFWVAALLPLMAGEIWLAALYGRLHLVEVIGRADEIARGDFRIRPLGLLARLSLGVVPLVLLLEGLRRSLLTGALLALGTLALAWGPADLDPITALRVLPWAIGGGASVAALLHLALSGPERRGAGLPGDRLLLVGWAGVWLLGVLLVHNFSAPRYMLPAVAPLAILLTRAVEARRSARVMLVAGSVAGVMLSTLVVHAEHRFFAAADGLANEVARAWQSPGSFTGEWAFRHAMRVRGWTFLDETSASGVLVVAPTNSSPGLLPEVKEHVADYAYGRGGWRVVCASCRIGLYSETLGVVPLGWSPGPLEEATAWRIR